MDPKRNGEILSAGFDAAREQLEGRPARPDYPHDYARMYGWLEDKVFNLYEAIWRKDWRHVRRMSGEIIVTASEIAEHTNARIEAKKAEKEEG
jgi:hypothetical protein